MSRESLTTQMNGYKKTKKQVVNETFSYENAGCIILNILAVAEGKYKDSYLNYKDSEIIYDRFMDIIKRIELSQIRKYKVKAYKRAWILHKSQSCGTIHELETMIYAHDAYLINLAKEAYGLDYEINEKGDLLIEGKKVSYDKNDNAKINRKEIISGLNDIKQNKSNNIESQEENCR